MKVWLRHFHFGAKVQGWDGKETRASQGRGTNNFASRAINDSILQIAQKHSAQHNLLCTEPTLRHRCASLPVLQRSPKHLRHTPKPLQALQTPVHLQPEWISGLAPSRSSPPRPTSCPLKVVANAHDPLTCRSPNTNNPPQISASPHPPPPPRPPPFSPTSPAASPPPASPHSPSSTPPASRSTSPPAPPSSSQQPPPQPHPTSANSSSPPSPPTTPSAPQLNPAPRSSSASTMTPPPHPAPGN